MKPSNLCRAVSAMLLIGCGSSPIEPPKTSQPQHQQNRFKLDFEEIMEFDQGKARSYTITAEVPPPGQPTLSVEGLPDGAVLEGATITYTPSCGLALAEGKFYRGYLSQRIVVTLKSDKDAESVLQKAGIILVHRHNDPERPCGE